MSRKKGVLELEADVTDRNHMPLYDYIIVGQDSKEQTIMRPKEMQGGSVIESMSRQFVLDFGEYRIIDRYLRTVAATVVLNKQQPYLKIRLTDTKPEKTHTDNLAKGETYD